METETMEPLTTSKNLDDVMTKCAMTGITPVNVHYGPSNLSVTPDNARVKQGRALRFHLQGQSSALVTVLSQDKDCSWLSGSGTSTFDVCVPEDAQLGKCKYVLSVKGVGTLDPHAEVIPN